MPALHLYREPAFRLCEQAPWALARRRLRRRRADTRGGAQGWTAVGTGVSESAAETVRAGGFEVHVGELDALPLANESFDAVSLVEVVEHVDDPAGLVRGARAG